MLLGQNNRGRGSKSIWRRGDRALLMCGSRDKDGCLSKVRGPVFVCLLEKQYSSHIACVRVLAGKTQHPSSKWVIGEEYNKKNHLPTCGRTEYTTAESQWWLSQGNSLTGSPVAVTSKGGNQLALASCQKGILGVKGSLWVSPTSWSLSVLQRLREPPFNREGGNVQERFRKGAQMCSS